MTWKAWLLAFAVMVLGIDALATICPVLERSIDIQGQPCAAIPQQRAEAIAHERLLRKADELAQDVRETAADVRASRLVRIDDNRPSPASSFDVIYETPLGQVIEINMWPKCPMELFLPNELPSPHDKFGQERRFTGERL